MTSQLEEESFNNKCVGFFLNQTFVVWDNWSSEFKIFVLWQTENEKTNVLGENICKFHFEKLVSRIYKELENEQ